MNLFVCISGHGLGHLSQVAPVVNILGKNNLDIKIFIESLLPESTLQEHIFCSFTLVETVIDESPVMLDALNTDLGATLQRYEFLRAQENDITQQYQELFKELKIDKVLSSISFFPLLAAQKSRLPNIAFCSMNWWDVLLCLFDDTVVDCFDYIKNAYCLADKYLAPQPCVEMPYLSNTVKVPPVGRLGKNRKIDLFDVIHANMSDRLILLGFGGMDFSFDYSVLPLHFDGGKYHYICRQNFMGASKQYFHSIKDLGLCYIDILTSVDAVITKPGYGMFVECAAAGTPVIWLKRERWPDVDSLCDYIQKYVPSKEFTEQQCEDGELALALEEVLAGNYYRKVSLTGADQVMQHLLF